MKQLKLRFRLLALIMVSLLIVAAVYGIYSVDAYGSRWVYSSRNSRVRYARKNVIPGDIYDRCGIKVAGSDEDGARVYQEDVLNRSSLVHILGDLEGYTSNGVESFQAHYLLGFEANLEDRIRSILNGEPLRGDNVTLTLNSTLSAEIVRRWRSNPATSGKSGAVVVLDYSTGEVLSIVSFPVYDPTNITDELKKSENSPFWNRAMQSTIPPGSTFKIVTAAAALENMEDAQSRTFRCTGRLDFGKRTVTDYGDAVHDEITLAKAFRVSCNNTFAQIALEIGDEKLKKTAVDFGFNENFLFDDLVVENSSYPLAGRSDVEIAWSGAGQSRVTVTPFHMCLIASAVANDGVMMQPWLVRKIVSPGGIIRKEGKPQAYRTVAPLDVARTLQSYMKDVVARGTGTKAKTEGFTVCGKTGSAETTLNGKYVTHAWFTGYIQEKNCPYAVCVFVEAGGTGGSVAAPMAGEVFSWLGGNCRKY